MLKGMFKKTTYINISGSRALAARTKEDSGNVSIPEGLWIKCPQCGGMLYSGDLMAAFKVCTHCGHHLRMGALERISMLLDGGSFEAWDEDVVTGNPLGFPEYEQRLKAVREKSGLFEAVITGYGRIEKEPVAIGVMDASFFMGSMGQAVGEKITRMVERAIQMRLPVILCCCSGGARMQEGIFSLMQMAKTSAAMKRLGEAGLPFFSLLTDPTTGGVTASFAMLGDVILAEPGALVGFAGPRVIEQTIGQTLPKGFQRAEFLREHGFVDKIVPRTCQRRVFAQLLRLHKTFTPKKAVEGGHRL